MAYAPPTIGPSGLTIPTYSDIQQHLLSAYQAIYGASTYLGTDASDYQFVSVFSLALADQAQGLQLAYNSFSPSTAIGASLDSVTKVNGIPRKLASYSYALVTVTGTVGATIPAGQVRDVNGLIWNFPPNITIPVGGSIVVQAVCSVAGAVTANPGTLITIATPTAGWTSVTNSALAQHPANRLNRIRSSAPREAVSVALPSQTMLDSTIAGVAAVPGVTRYNILENPTGTTDSYGNPAHSITAVVEGGANIDVATAIYTYRGIGCQTNGTTAVAVPDAQNGVGMTINFDRPTYVPIYVSLTVHGLTGFTSATQAAIQSAIATYLNSLQIGELVTLSALYGAAMSVTPNLSIPLFSIRALTIGASPSPTGTSDLVMSFYQVAQGNISNVVITLA